MKRKMILISVLSLLMLATAVAPAMAIGPSQAVEVGHNPNLVGITDLMTPRGDRISWETTGMITFWANASYGQGKMNNAISATHDTLVDILSNPEDYYNKWVYLSGEVYGNKWNDPSDLPDRGEHGMLYWVLRWAGYNHGLALLFALAYPDGVYMRIMPVG